MARGRTRKTVDVLSRRDVLRAALTAIPAALAPHAPNALAGAEMPRFESANHQFTIVRPERELPSIRLFRLEGGTIDLSSLRGKPILLNFWATWCAACRIELPILERQYREVWRDSLHAIAVSEDRGSREAIERYLKALDIRTLPVFLDPHGFAAYSDSDNNRRAPFALYGMPITYLISSAGLVVGYMPGAADWSSAGANDLIEFLRRT